MSSLLQRTLLASRWLFAPASVIFLLLAGYTSRESFQHALINAHMLPLAIAVLLCATMHLVTPIFSWLVLRESEVHIPYAIALRIHVSRLPARYLPGGIWQTVSRMTDLHRIGVNRSQLTTLIMMENLVPLGVSLAFGGLLMGLAGDTRLLILAPMLGGLLLLAITPLALRHRLLLHIKGFALARYVILIAVTTAFWVIAASAFACYWSAFPATGSGLPLLKIFGSYLLAWAAGFAAIFAPQGIGVFESVAGLLLHGSLPFGGIAVLISGFRATVLAGDLLTYGVFLLLRHGQSRCREGLDNRH